MNNELKIAIANKLDSRSAQELLTRFAEQDAEMWSQTEAELDHAKARVKTLEQTVDLLSEQVKQERTKPKGWVFPAIGDKLRLVKDFKIDQLQSEPTLKAGAEIVVGYYSSCSQAPDYNSVPAIGDSISGHCIPLTHLEPA